MSESAPRARPRRGVAPRVVFAGLVASFLVAGAVAAWIYARYVAYERVATRHVYPSAAALLRVDLEQVVTYDPFRRHLLPLVKRGGHDARLKPRLDRLKHHTRVELGVDIRELVYATGPGPKQWSLALGGVFPSSGVVRGLHRVLDEEGIFSELTVNQLELSGGARMTQAADGVVVIASDEASASAAAAGAGRPVELGLPASAPVALALDATRLSEAARTALGHRLGLNLDGMRMTARLIPEKPLRCEVQTLGHAGSADLLKTITRLTGIPASEIEAKNRSKGVLTLTFPITSQHLDNAAGELAQWLSFQLALPKD